MTGVKHAFTSGKADDADATLVNPSDWNAEHEPNLTTKGDIIARGASASARLAVGSNDQVLMAASGEATGLKYGDVILKTLYTTKGDIIVRSTVPARLAVGNEGELLVVRSSPAQGVAWEVQNGTLNFIIDGGGAVITTGEKGHLIVDFAATILAVTMLGDQSGSIVVDIWKDTYANYPPANADSITASAVPTISGATKSQDATLTGWTTSIAAGDVLAFNVDSIATIQRLLISLKIKRI